eukprot:SAG22_NODE_64_length_23238_cov_83.185566_6_plen_227_part_00
MPGGSPGPCLEEKLLSSAGDPDSDAAAPAGAGAGSSSAVPAAAAAAAGCCRADPPLLPVAWLFVLGSWVPPQSIFWSLIQSIIVPAQVTAIVGDARKQVALGYVATCTQIGGSWGPLMGTLSDRCDSPCGRRRPFMFLGPLSFCGALLVMQRAGPSLDVFAAGNFLFCFTGAIHCAPFNAILPEIVPPSQRSFAGAVMSWTGTIGSQISAALGVLVGQKVLSCKLL